MDLLDELLAAEHALWEANLAGDGGYYARVLRDDALSVSPFGVAGKDQAVALISANRNPYTAYEITGPQARPVGDRGGLLTYQVAVQGEAPDGPFSWQGWATSVSERQDDGTWRSVLFQLTFPPAR